MFHLKNFSLGRDRGLSPMVATILLIAMTMIIGGILAAGIRSTTPEDVEEAGIVIDGVSPGSDHLEITVEAAGPYMDAFHIVDNVSDGNNDNVVWNNLELRIAGETVKADIIKATSNGMEVSAGPSIGNNGDNWNRNIDFNVGDLLEIENIKPVINGGDRVLLIWKPKNQTLYDETA